MSVRTALRTWLATDRPPSARRPRRFAVEQLEDRTVPTAVSVPNGLVSWWTANNTAADATGLNPATLTNVTYTAGEVGQGWNFNGSNGWASLGDPSSLAFTASFTIEGWIRVSNSPPTTNFGSIVFRGDNRGGLDPYQLVIRPSGNIQFQINGTTSGASIEAPVPTGQFVHVAATLDDATGAMTLYENGAVVAHTTTTARPFGALDPTQNPGVGIGNSNYLNNYNVPFNGVIDELAMYGRALSAGEVIGITEAGTDGKVTGPLAVDAPSVLEGAAGMTTPATFTLRRTGSLTDSLTVNWATSDDSATAGTDYVAASGTVTFAPGEATKAVTITVNGDATVELDEAFKLVVTPAGGTAIMGLATIVNDDAGVSLSDATTTEGDARIGQSLGAFVSQSNNGGMQRSTGMAWGPDGNLYVGSHGTNQVLKYDGTTGAFLGTFVNNVDSPAAEGLTFRPDGKLYVLSRVTAQVQRFDATTGAFLDVFIPSGSGGLSEARGMTVGPDGDWYISSGKTNQVLHYSGATGAFIGAFVPAGSGGLSNPRGLTFGPDGNLYVASASNNSVLRYNGQTGAFLGAFVPSGSGGLLATGEVVFSGGSLYVSSTGGDEVLRYDTQTGAFIDKAVSAVSSAIATPLGLLFDPAGNLLVGCSYKIDRFGPRSQAAFTVSLNIPSATPVTVYYTTASGSATAGSDFTPVSGTLTFAPGQTTKTIVVSTLNDSLVEGNETFTLNLSNPVGATVTRAQATGTITDDDTTKFYVANDGTTDRTYRYGVPGNALADTTLDSGDTAPRGMATTAAGDKVWVVDANKTVYVYSAAGALLGSWTAGGLPVKSQIEGLATNGTDVWLVDAKADRVYLYAGAAARLSGSQSAAGGFALNAADSNAKGIVTDGTSLWVVDDGSSTDRVFKYTLTGGLLGSWTIDAANAHPTGLTVNPASVSDIWIVDNVSLKVYQYAAAAGRTSGGQTASATFALAAGNANPQDIADPPPAAQPPLPALPMAMWTPISPPSAPAADAPRPLSWTGAGVPEPTPPAAAGTVRPSPLVQLGADWFRPEDLDLSPIVVDPVRVSPRRR